MYDQLMRTALFFLVLCVAVVGAGSSTASVRDLAAAEVFVYKETLPDSVRYTYVVRNTGDAPITGLEIGFDHYTGSSELTGDVPTSIVSPAGWEGHVITLEESDFHSVEWEPATPDRVIQPGQMKVGFILTVPSDRQDLVSGHWTVTLDGSIAAASSRLEQIDGPAPGNDTLPPLLTVTASPATLWPPDAKLRNIAVSITVSDDTDPNPAVKLLSVSCTDCAAGDVADATIGTDDRALLLRASRVGRGKAGRVYSLTYQAQDSSGNTTTSVAKVTVPHDQR